MRERERERERVSVPSNLCVNESWNECDLHSVCENGRLVSECGPSTAHVMSGSRELDELIASA